MAINKQSASDLVGSPDKDSPQKKTKPRPQSQKKNSKATAPEQKKRKKKSGSKNTNNNNKGKSMPQDKAKRGRKSSSKKTSSKKTKKSQNNSNGHLNSLPDGDLPTETIKGILDTSRNGHGVLRMRYSGGERDAYISSSQMRRFNLKNGDVVEGPARRPKDNERYWGLLQIDTINDIKAEKFRKLDRLKFKSLTPVYPNERIKLEISKNPLSLRIIDMVAPIGKGQRSLIVSPPKAGKTTLLKNIATGVAHNSPEIYLMAVLVGERPEEVTDIRRHIARITDGEGEVAASNFDESAEDQCRVAELALARAKRKVEMGGDVMILLDSITRLARAYNLSIPTSGRTLSGGFDPAALFPPKHFFGAARNFENKGSLTIIGTTLVDTGSRMDDLIYEEFKGTGNQEIHLDRRLAERRIYPAIDVQRSGTRKDELLLDQMTYQSVVTLQRMLDTFNKEERTSTLLGRLKRTDSNKEFLASLKNG